MAALTLAEQKFVDEFLKTGNAAQAVVHSGIRDGRGPVAIAEDLLTQPHIKEAIESAPASERAIVELDKNTVLAEVQEVQEKAMAENRYSEALSALKLKTDILGFKTTKVEISHNKSIKDMSDAELLEILEKSKQGRILNGKVD